MKHPKATIFVCADGICTILCEGEKNRRLNAALPVIEVANYVVARDLVQKLCSVVRVDHGKKVGMLLEFKVPGWKDEPDVIKDIQNLKRQFEELLGK